MITREFNLVIRVPQQNYIDTGLEVVQNDQNVYKFNIRITDGINDIDYTQVDSATITFAKGDGHVVQGDLVATGSGFVYEMGTNEIAYPGQVVVSIQLFGDIDERLTTSQFSFKVVRDLITPSALKSSSQFPLLQQLLAEVNQLKIDIVNLQVPDNSLTESKMALDMKKNISGGIAGYNELLLLGEAFNAGISTLQNAVNEHKADNALHFFRDGGFLSGEVNFDTLTANRVYQLLAPTGTNVPAGVGYGILLYWTSGAYGLQMCVDVTSNKLLVRTNSGTWNTWVEK